MVKFDEFLKTLDPDARIDVYDIMSGFELYRGKVRECKNLEKERSLMRTIAQSTSREVYLELYVR